MLNAEVNIFRVSLFFPLDIVSNNIILRNLSYLFRRSLLHNFMFEKENRSKERHKFFLFFLFLFISSSFFFSSRFSHFNHNEFIVDSLFNRVTMVRIFGRCLPIICFSRKKRQSLPIGEQKTSGTRHHQEEVNKLFVRRVESIRVTQQGGIAKRLPLTNVDDQRATSKKKTFVFSFIRRSLIPFCLENPKQKQQQLQKRQRRKRRK